MNAPSLEQIQPITNALRNTDLLAVIDQKTQGKRSAIKFPYMKCDTSALITHICLGYELVMGIYIHSRSNFELYRTRLIEHMDPKKREGLKSGIMSETFLSHYIRTYHYFNFNDTRQEYVDVTHEQYDPTTPLYIGEVAPPSVSDVRRVLLTEGDRMNPNTRDVIREICSERGLIKDNLA